MATNKNVEPFITPKFRAAFVFVFKPKAPREEGKKPRYTLLALFPKGTDLTKLKAGTKEAAVNLWDSKADNIVKMPNFKSPYKPALEIVNTDGEPYFPWAEGYVAVEFWSYTAPGVAGPAIDPATGKVEILTVESDFYSGAWARAKVRPYAYDGRKDQKGFGINFELINIQKLQDDEPLGSAARTRAEDDFEPVKPPEEDDFM